VGVYKFNASVANWARVAANGGQACPATGIQVINLAAPVILYPGFQYYAAIAFDNTTATFTASTVVPSGGISAFENPNWQTSKYTSGSYPLPATLASGPAASLKVPLLAVR
jgi:hypothetical protein